MIINIVLMIVEYVKLLLVLCGIFGLKRKKKAVAAWIVFGSCIVCLIVEYLLGNESLSSPFMDLVIPICALQLQGKKRFLISTLLYFGICALDDVVNFLTMKIFSLPKDIYIDNPLLIVGINSLTLCAFAIAAVIMLKKKKSKEAAIQNVDTLYLVVCLVGVLVFTFIMTVFGRHNFEWNEVKIRTIAGCVCTLGAFFLVAGILLIYNASSKKYYQNIAGMNNKILRAQERYYQMLLEKENETRRFRHDISNHILCLDTLLAEHEYQEAEQYLSNLKGDLQELGTRAQTGNMLVNAILNDIAGKYANVMFEWDGHLPQRMQLPNTDICVIFSNILENAFCAAAACYDSAKVDVKVQEINSGLKICVENNMATPIQEKEGRLLTQKTDKKNHGFGTMNVRECVKKNGGSTEYQYTETTFGVKILLPNVI